MDPVETVPRGPRGDRPNQTLLSLHGVVSRDRARDLVAVAAEALARYKLRTSLSVLGVVLGVAAVIAMMSVSEGARREALQQVEALGLDNLVARNRAMTAGESSEARRSGLTVSDTESLRELMPDTLSVTPLLERVLAVSRGGNAVATRVLGVRPDYQDILRLRVKRGRFLVPADELPGARVGVLGSALARRLFIFEDPIGRFIRVEDEYFQVVGTLGEQGTQSPAIGAMAWRDLNDSVLIPLPALSGQSLEVTPAQRVDEIWLQTQNGDRVEALGSVLAQTLQRLHGGSQDVEIVVPRELLAQRYRTQRTFSVVVGSIAAIALLIGGIGVMNIMLMSVVERTHEIGIRRTVGATRAEITVQFLVESVLMTLAGGFIGIVIGVVSAVGITAYAGWSTHVSPSAILLGVIVSSCVGIGFGVYPAMKAAHLEPVEALRYE